MSDNLITTRALYHAVGNLSKSCKFLATTLPTLNTVTKILRQLSTFEAPKFFATTLPTLNTVTEIETPAQDASLYIPRTLLYHTARI